MRITVGRSILSDGSEEYYYNPDEEDLIKGRVQQALSILITQKTIDRYRKSIGGDDEELAKLIWRLYTRQ
jgi:hypothetical protein